MIYAAPRSCRLVRWLSVLLFLLIGAAAAGSLMPALGAPQTIAEPYRTFVVSLPRGVRSLPDIRLLRQGDGLLISVHTADEALREIEGLRRAIRNRGGNPNSYKYIVRTFPADLGRTAFDPSGPSFFANTSTADIARLQARTFAIMFDHEPVWYWQSPDRLPAWHWDYAWSLRQIRVLAREVDERGFRAGAIVTGHGESRWAGRAGASELDGFAGLLKQSLTDLSYLIIQAQAFCRADGSGVTYAAFAEHLAREIGRTFGPNAMSQLQNIALQVSLGDTLGNGSNVVPSKWAERCLDAVPPPTTGSAALNAFFLFPQRRSSSACEVLMYYRYVPGATCN